MEWKEITHFDRNIFVSTNTWYSVVNQTKVSLKYADRKNPRFVII